MGLQNAALFLLGSGLCTPRSWRRVKIRIVEQVLTHSPSPTPHPQDRADWGCPLYVPQPMGALDIAPHLPYAEVAAACRVLGLVAARRQGGGAGTEDSGCI